MRELSSLQNPLVKQLVKLRKQRALREAQQRVLVMGSQVLRELKGQVPVHRLFLAPGVDAPCAAEELYRCSAEVVAKIADLPQEPDCVAELSLPPWQALNACRRVLCLDRIRDPGNVGTLLRTAQAFGFEGVFFVEGSADPYGEKALRAGKGAAFGLRLQRGTAEELLQFCQASGHRLLLADLEGASVGSHRGQEPFALLLGSEVEGVDECFGEYGQRVSIPMSGQTESLNVAVAGGIAMYLLSEGDVE
jgi:TrmH family RNA methyltransferase